MGLQDFWDNVRTPGFVETMFEELAVICKDAKNEFVSLMEEGEEVFIDGFQEMVINKNGEYKNSVQKRDAANIIIDEIHQQLLAARGFNDGASSYTFGTIGRTLSHAATAMVSLDPDKINDIIANLQEVYTNLLILKPEALLTLSNKINELVTLPEAPQYERPYSEKEATFLDAELRKQRVAAADDFIAKARDYEEMMKAEVAKQKEAGILFEPNKIDGEVYLILEEYERHLSIENISLKFFARKDDELSQDDWLIVRLSLLLAAGIHSITNLALVSTNSTESTIMTDELMAALVSAQGEIVTKEANWDFLTEYVTDIQEEINKLKLSVAGEHGAN